MKMTLRRSVLPAVALPHSRGAWLVAVTALLFSFGALLRVRGESPLPMTGPADSPPLTAAAGGTTQSVGQVVPAEKPGFHWPAEATGGTMEVAEAVMVTVELDFGPTVPSIAEALAAVERRYQPDDGVGRTFAILDAYGEPTADGKLHISMHVSSEKPGRAALVFRKTGAILWHARIQPSTHPAHSPFAGKNLDIMVADEQGADFLLDGSKVSESIFDAIVRDRGLPLRDFWPDAAERQLTFFYSACGCPVKVLCRRMGDRTRRTKDLPVIFPDDPDVVATITRLLGWGRS